MKGVFTALVLSGLLLALAQAGPIPPGPSAAYINNSASAQTAQFNVGTGTVRGTLTVTTINTPAITATTLTAVQLMGGGAAITSLTPANISAGTIPAAVAYGGVPVPVANGGTGSNLSATTQGKIPYFSGTGVIGTIAAGTSGQVLQSSGATGVPSFTSAPFVLGTNITAIPLASLNAGTLAATVVASSITNTAVTPGVYGGPAQIPQVTIAADGRITSASQSALSSDLPFKSQENIFTRFNKFTSSVAVDGAFYAAGTNITGVIFSTAAIQAQINSVAISTGVLTTGLAAEIVTRAADDAAIRVTTGTLTTGLAAEIVTRAAADAAIRVTTGTLTTGLAAEIVARVVADTSIGLTTGTLRVDLSSVILSTGTIQASLNSVIISTSNLAYLKTTGTHNIIVGVDAGTHLTTAERNAYLGWSAGHTNIDGDNNTAIGNSSGYNNISEWNTFLGSQSGVVNSTGSYNTFIGGSAGGTSVSGVGNIAIGYATKMSADVASHELNIGDAIYGTNIGGFNFSLGEAFIGIGTSAPASNLHVVGTTGLKVSTATTSSDSFCFVGAVASLPITGYARGCLAYLNSDPTKIYLSTETVVGTFSWLAK